MEPSLTQQAAKELRQYAEMTAKHSQNWDNYEKICHSIINQLIDQLGEANERER